MENTYCHRWEIWSVRLYCAKYSYSQSQGVFDFDRVIVTRLTSYGKEPQQSVILRGRAKRIPPNKHTDSNKMIMTKFTIPLWQISNYNSVNGKSAKNRPTNSTCAWNQTWPRKWRFDTTKSSMLKNKIFLRNWRKIIRRPWIIHQCLIPQFLTTQ